MKAVEQYNLKGITSDTVYSTGELKECKLEEYNEIRVRQNTYTPRYKGADERKKDNKALSFYESGNIKSIALEEQTEIITPIGSTPAELVTFYEDGSIDSLFPCNGQLGFGWSEEDEEKLQMEQEFSLAFASFHTKIIGVRFYQSQKLKSIILWPKSNVEIQTPLGVYPVRVGLRMYEDGTLESFEPARPIALKTPIGEIIAFDQNALGMDADYNSVNFYWDGRLRSVSTNSDIVVNDRNTGERTIIYQQLRLDMISGEMVKLPIIVEFQEDKVIIDNGSEKKSFLISASKFLFLHDGSFRDKKCSPGSDCSGCGAACM